MKTLLHRWLGPWRLGYSATVVALRLLLLALPGPNLCAQPVPHHFDGITALPNKTATLTHQP